MAKVDYSESLIKGKSGVTIWASMANGDYGASKESAHISDKTVHVYGTFGSGGSVSLYGSNNPDDLDVAPSSGTWVKLTDNNGNDVTFTTDGGALIAENYYYICAEVTAGDATTSLNVAVSAVS